MKNHLFSIKEASKWASDHLKRDISTSNISYLIQYGKVKKHGANGTTQIDSEELRKYYDSFHGKREIEWKDKLGKDLNWALSFDDLREKDTTKHVHRLHPYKGKFIPQLVKYFIDDHVNNFKKEVFFKSGDIILDPFAGSGTTLVQANELNIHSIGIDISKFNCTITESKLQDYDIVSLLRDVKNIINSLKSYEAGNRIIDFEKELLDELRLFNYEHFPSPNFKYDLGKGKYVEDRYAFDKSILFAPIYNRLKQKYNIMLKQKLASSFLDQWYTNNVRKEIEYTLELIKNVKDSRNKKILAIILSRTIRSCRATTHSDLGTLKEPQFDAYYCYKHKKICKPIFSIKTMFNRYAIDTVKRLSEFRGLKTAACYAIFADDSRNIEIDSKLMARDENFYKMFLKKKIKGIFTSPPYVGQIDYHEQHAYAYELFGFKRKDDKEIGRLFEGQGIEARKSYVKGISDVLSNCLKYMDKNPDVFIVANDKYNLYPEIAKRAGLLIINEYKRPVLNRTERDKNPYSEKIFHLVRKDKHNN